MYRYFRLSRVCCLLFCYTSCLTISDPNFNNNGEDDRNFSGLDDSDADHSDFNILQILRRHLLSWNRVAKLSEILNKIVSDRQAAYCASEYITVDEMLVPFRGYCGFRAYMSKKPQ